MEVVGEIIVIGPTETIGAKGFKKRLLVVKTDGQYPQTIPIEFVQDKCSLLDLFQLGQNVSVSINLQGSEWNGKYYCNLQGWKIFQQSKELSSGEFMPNRQAIDNAMEQAEEEYDDLPF